jgi:phospholipase/carboxylesterase
MGIGMVAVKEATTGTCMSEILKLATTRGELIYRLQRPGPHGGPPVIMLHGLTGDEDVMWLLTSAFPSQGLIASPRGLFPAEEGGYSWVKPDVPGGGRFADFQDAVAAVMRLLAHLSAQFSLPARDFVLMGFSQGAALALTIARNGFRPAGVATLAGYLPDGGLKNLDGLPVYWGHGSQDERVPVERARRDVARLRQSGAEVTYCEAPVGHKVGVECMHDLAAWFTGITAQTEG